jgi:uncharacterized protein YjbJ (UPF0337 family)
MTEHDKADQARKGLLDSVKGKAKEVIGAVTGNDSLTAEGQLEQTQAQERKAANSVEAVADAEAEQAHDERVDAKLEGVKERNAVNHQAAAAQGAVQAQQDAQKHAAEQAGAKDIARESTLAEVHAQQEIEQAKAEAQEDASAAAEGFSEAVDDHRTAQHVTANAHEQADRIRARAEQLSNDAGLN